jgi:hypothetical protein
MGFSIMLLFVSGRQTYYLDYILPSKNIMIQITAVLSVDLIIRT